MMRLSTFTLSHFSEKARWALDLNGIPFIDRRLVPGAHMLTIRRRSPKTTVPVLEHDGSVIQGSSAILDYIEERLGKTRLAPPRGEEGRSRELEALADKAFGRGTQRVFYATLLDHPSTVIDLWSQGGPFWARSFVTVTYPLIARVIRKKYSVREEKVRESKDLFRRAFDTFDAALEKGGPFILGDALSRIDVTVAALLAPMCEPPEHELRWPERSPPELAAFLADFENRPTFSFAKRMYRNHRRPSSGS